MRVVAAMSGGVDSAVAAARARQAGHDVVGVHLALTSVPNERRTGSRGCCSVEDATDARRVADRLGIPFYVWDMAREFQADVIDDFVAEYAAGRTPNPCLRCNERIKFAALLDKAWALGFDGVATGHYARISEPGDALNTTGRRELHRAVDARKDQSYVLGVLDADQLASAVFPLGAQTKPEIRREAAELGLAVADKPDSHDICFIADGDTRGFLADRLGASPGEIVDEEGRTVGEHQGAYAYTVGQRRGLALRRPHEDGRPRYVTAVDVPANRVVVGPAELLGIDTIEATAARWCGPAPTGDFGCGVQLRAHGAELPAVANVDGDVVRIRLADRARGVAAGQAAVLYDGTRVVGSATITATARA